MLNLRLTNIREKQQPHKLFDKKIKKKTTMIVIDYNIYFKKMVSILENLYNLKSCYKNESIKHPRFILIINEKNYTLTDKSIRQIHVIQEYSKKKITRYKTNEMFDLHKIKKRWVCHI